MSAAKKWEWEWTVPPGYRGLADVLREYGRARAQTKLISGEWPAFELDLDTGDLRPILATTWCVYHGRSLLDRAEDPSPDDGGAIHTNHWFVVIVRISEQPPSKINNLRGRKLARALIDTVYPQGEWRQMKGVVVRKGCEKEAKTRSVQLPSADSFSRAMCRRRK
jgi:hypothetical protein